MKNNRTFRVFIECLKKYSITFILIFAINLLNYTVFSFYGIMTEAFLYSAVISTALFAVVFIVDFAKEIHRASERKHIVACVNSDRNTLPEPKSLLESDYCEIITELGKALDKIIETNEAERQDTADYYTTWVHQIKTPIAVLKLKLSNDTDENKALSSEVFRIEQYVDMVLSYIRLGSKTNDLVICKYPLDELIRETIRKYAPQFILKKLTLDYTPTKSAVTTDKKWFSDIVGQLISNAIKYTPGGCIKIYEKNFKLYISDTGIGIAKEDLPRIFEKGYTGINGRTDKHSSGLGLFLAKSAADKLSVKISAESEIGKGSTFIIDFSNCM